MWALAACATNKGRIGPQNSRTGSVSGTPLRALLWLPVPRFAPLCCLGDRMFFIFNRLGDDFEVLRVLTTDR
jgi:hypothetical protein